MICYKHGVEMPTVPDRDGHWLASLHRCPVCTADYRAMFVKATRVKSRRIHNLRQRVLPPVIMSERWP